MVKKKRAKKRVKRMAKKSAQTQIRNKKREISGQKSPMTYDKRGPQERVPEYVEAVMMRLENVRSAYEDLAAKASDIVRQISLAGVGIIWVFKSSTSTSLSLDPKLLWAVLLFSLPYCSIFSNMFSEQQYGFSIFDIERRKVQRETMNS